MKKELIELRVNGRKHELAIEPSELLLDVLRQEMDLTGSKRGCDDSSCGACTVLVDGVPTLSCTVLAMSCASDEQDGPDITTVEGIADHGALAAIQSATGSPREIAARYGVPEGVVCKIKHDQLAAALKLPRPQIRISKSDKLLSTMEQLQSTLQEVLRTMAEKAD